MITHWRQIRRLQERCIKAGEQLEPQDRALLASALRLAAEQYDADGVANDQIHARISGHFEGMAQRARLMAEALES